MLCDGSVKERRVAEDGQTKGFQKKDDTMKVDAAGQVYDRSRRR